MEEKLVKSILLATANAFAPPEKLGRPRTDHGLLIDTFIRVLRTGMPWRDVRDVDFRTAHRHFILWARGGIFEKTYRRLLALCSRRKRDGTFLAIDTTFVKNVFGTDVLGRNPTDRGRKASKVVAVVDERGLPHRLGFLPANVSDYKVLHSVLPLPKGVMHSEPQQDELPLSARHPPLSRGAPEASGPHPRPPHGKGHLPSGV